MTTPDTADTTVRVTRHFEAAPARVFDAWLIREEWQAWIGPEGMHCDVPLLEPHVGGRYLISMRLTADQRVPVGGIFKAIDRPRTLVFTWGRADDPARASLLTLVFKPQGGATELAFRQEGLPSVASRDDHTRGWNVAFDKLARHLAATAGAGAAI